MELTKESKKSRDTLFFKTYIDALLPKISLIVQKLKYYFILKDFLECYSDIEKKILDCDFFSIDCELSGITNFKNLNAFDTPRSRYEKMKKVFI